MPAQSFIEPMENILNGKCKYEYFDYQNNEFSITKKTRILHIEMPNSGDMNSNIVVLTFTIRKQDEKWKIQSEGSKRQNPGDMVPLRNTALQLARNNDWKFVAVAIAGMGAEDDVITQYVVAIESYTYGNETVYDLSNELHTLKMRGCPNFYRTEITIRQNVYSLVFIKKEYFVDYLIMFDDRPYQMISRVKKDNNWKVEAVEQEYKATETGDSHETSYVIKPFSIPDSLPVSEDISQLRIDAECVEAQFIHSGDKVLFLNEHHSRLRLYNVFLIGGMQKDDNIYDINIVKKQKVNRAKEDELIQQFNEEE